MGAFIQTTAWIGTIMILLAHFPGISDYLDEGRAYKLMCWFGVIAVGANIFYSYPAFVNKVELGFQIMFAIVAIVSVVQLGVSRKPRGLPPLT